MQYALEEHQEIYVVLRLLVYEVVNCLEGIK
jgi:hypothetical protein